MVHSLGWQDWFRSASVCPLFPGLHTWWSTWSLVLGTVNESSFFGDNHLLTNFRYAASS